MAFFHNRQVLFYIVLFADFEIKTMTTLEGFSHWKNTGPWYQKSACTHAAIQAELYFGPIVYSSQSQVKQTVLVSKQFSQYNCALTGSFC